MQLLVNRLSAVFFVMISVSFSASINAGEQCNIGSIKTEDILHCSKVSYEKLDAVLNEQYKAISHEIPAEKMAMLRVVQRDWIAYKESYCQAVYDSVYPGNEAGIDKFGCLAKLTAARVNDLVYMRTGVESDGFHQSIVLLKNMGVNADFQKVSAFLSEHKISDGKWEQFASKHCQFMMELFKEEAPRCMARMRYQALME